MSIACNSDIEKSRSADHLEYFGFTLIDTSWDDPSDNDTKTNYLDEVSSFSNIGDILVVTPTDNIDDRIRAFTEVEVKPLIHISELFFEQEGNNAPSGINYNLRPDYQSRWDQFTSINNTLNTQGNIACFYLGEEPTWNGISYADLKSASDYIKSTSDIPIMIIEAYPAIDQLQIPTSVDWYGFDHYFIKSPHTDATYLSEVDLIQSKQSRDNQRMILIMDSHYIPELHGASANIELPEMQSIANSYYEIAKSDKEILGIIGYFWPSGFDRSNAIGARNMPIKTIENFRRIGEEISGK